MDSSGVIPEYWPRPEILPSVGRDLHEQWAKTEVHLRAALDEIRSSIDPKSVGAVEEYLDQNELGLALDVLVEAALASETPALPGAVEHLRAASVEMEYQPYVWDEFVSRFGGHS